MEVNFYRLDTSKYYSAVGDWNKIAIQSCIFTDGVVTGVNVLSRPSEDVEGEVQVLYKFTDNNMRERFASVKGRYSYGVPFFAGQNILVGFNGSYSCIMQKFTLMPDDMLKFKANESARSDDDFDGLTNELLDIDLSKPVKPLEYNALYIWVAICLSVILIIAFPLYLLFFVVLMQDAPTLIVILSSAFAVIFLLVLLISIVRSLFTYSKRKKRVNKILSNNPYFVWGRVFYSEKTYTGGEYKQLLYCYIDKWGEKHTEQIKGRLMNLTLRPRETAIAYTADGNSLPLDTFTLLNE